MYGRAFRIGFWVGHELLAFRLRRIRLRGNAIVAHLAVSGELRTGFDGDFACFDVAYQVGCGFQGKQFRNNQGFSFHISFDFNVGTLDVSFHHAASSDDDFGFGFDVAAQGAVNAAVRCGNQHRPAVGFLGR